ncbi:predicted protein [Pyrenophora tritici-repentis Pt-1C-BFP]|uniref:Uncharacterized protein n=1 Tax=Pyrenophora tritici-repentis (strain Pt-1C-BFP) TaxID=426418 RepID=B2WIL2_PYRTR|nr:uncharacterized protein PTRG_09821 [Pyrenophora tritici-repentis Pt-1C-BFP]EDU42872.1 predicted protein [Pyrenophora tritici-repentis Pt-1C-BFP]
MYQQRHAPRLPWSCCDKAATAQREREILVQFHEKRDNGGAAKCAHNNGSCIQDPMSLCARQAPSFATLANFPRKLKLEPAALGLRQKGALAALGRLWGKVNATAATARANRIHPWRRMTTACKTFPSAVNARLSRNAWAPSLYTCAAHALDLFVPPTLLPIRRR